MVFLQIALAALIAGMLDTVVGFGGALLLIPMLVLIVGGKDAVLLAALIPLGWNIPRVVMLRGWVRWRVVGLFAIGILPGTYIGAQLLSRIDAALLATIIGWLLVAFGAYYVVRMYVTLPEPRALRPWAYPLVGLVSGIIGGVMGAGHGPLQTGALVASAMPVREVAATNGALGGISTLARLGGYGLEGMLAEELWLPGLIGVAAAWAGATMGVRMARRAKDSTLELIVGIVMMLAGVRMLMS